MQTPSFESCLVINTNAGFLVMRFILFTDRIQSGNEQYDQRHEKTCILKMQNQTRRSATAKLINAFVFAKPGAQLMRVYTDFATCSRLVRD